MDADGGRLGIMAGVGGKPFAPAIFGFEGESMTLKIVVLTGGRGAGKTTTAATIGGKDGEKNTVIFDFEDSTSSVADWFAGTVINAHERFASAGIDPRNIIASVVSGREMPYAKNKNHLADVWWWFLGKLSKLPTGTKIVVVDTWEPLETALNAAIEARPEAFGWSRSTVYGRKATEGFRPAVASLRSMLEAIGVEILVLNTHVKQAWVNDKVVPNKVKPAGNENFISIYSSMWFWMVKDANGTPAALVLKGRKERREYDDEGFAHVFSILPRRIPAPFSWAKVAKYAERPADLSNPEPGEMPTDEEMAMMSQMLTSAQMALMVSSAQKEAAMVSVNTENLSEETVQKILQFHADGVNEMLIAVRIGEPIAVVRATIAGNVEKEVDGE